MSSPRRQRRRSSSTGQPSARSPATAADHRCARAERREYGGGVPSPVEGDQQGVNASPGTLRAISDFGSRAASSDGRPRLAAGPRRSTSRRPAPASTANQQARRPDLVAGALDEQADRARAARSGSSRRPRTAASSYCRSTFIARTTTGACPPSSKPPRPNSGPAAAPAGRGAGDPAGSTSSPTTRTSGRTRRSRSYISTVVTGEAPKPRSTTSGSAAARSRAAGAGQPTVDPAQPVRPGGPPRRHPDRPRPARGQSRRAPSQHGPSQYPWNTVRVLDGRTGTGKVCSLPCTTTGSGIPAPCPGVASGRRRRTDSTRRWLVHLVGGRSPRDPFRVDRRRLPRASPCCRCTPRRSSSPAPATRAA